VSTQLSKVTFPVRIVDPGYPAGGVLNGEVILQAGLDAGGSVRSADAIVAR
jgi:hypothetical protein